MGDVEIGQRNQIPFPSFFAMISREISGCNLHGRHGQLIDFNELFGAGGLGSDVTFLFFELAHWINMSIFEALK